MAADEAAGVLRVSAEPLIIKDGGELTGRQQEFLLKKYSVKCNTRPLRPGHVRDLCVEGEEAQDWWRELTCHGDVDNIQEARAKAIVLCAKTLAERQRMDPAQRAEYEAAHQARVTEARSAKQLRWKEANIKAHNERQKRESAEALERKA